MDVLAGHGGQEDGVVADVEGLVWERRCEDWRGHWVWLLCAGVYEVYLVGGDGRVATT